LAARILLVRSGRLTFHRALPATPSPIACAERRKCRARSRAALPSSRTKTRRTPGGECVGRGLSVERRVHAHVVAQPHGVHAHQGATAGERIAVGESDRRVGRRDHRSSRRGVDDRDLDLRATGLEWADNAEHSAPRCCSTTSRSLAVTTSHVRGRSRSTHSLLAPFRGPRPTFAGPVELSLRSDLKSALARPTDGLVRARSPRPVTSRHRRRPESERRAGGDRQGVSPQ
jgi:hypothetical protein